ncbi:GNAT family N-acetyltransferase [Siccirubricoccus deserti]|uniref:GNAT family N-acetyltransferase n=1 Tax=Siccirubricoccus deserti TaxID=2013562 RepID=A0A9X0UFP2_9PROT|nr:GNAT family N-acetyltransferase [Siccirubricoccus deserti]MBC4018987.1 GNAT family N-acetyltransferase [Siccirubricoccus deserti]
MNNHHPSGLATPLAPTRVEHHVSIRPVRTADAEVCGRIIHDAFAGIAAAHGFPKDFPSGESGIALARALAEDPAYYGVVATIGETVVGSNFLSKVDEVRGVGPITVDPSRQAEGIGRQLMQAVLDRAQDAASVRLVQDAFNTRSLALYASLGFEVQAPLLLMHGTPRGEMAGGMRVRPMEEADIPACDALCSAAHGVTRTQELRQAIGRHAPMVLERHGRMVGYLTAPGVWLANHGVAETEQDMAALLAGAATARGEPISLLLPSCQAGLLRWCLAEGMRVVKPMTLMSRGRYRQPAHCWFPSVFY